MDESDAPVLDATVLSELSGSVGGDREFVVELIRTFLSDGAEQVEAIDAAVAAGDDRALVRPAHTLKSSSATLGASRVSATARTLEMAGRSGSLGASVAEDVESLHAEWEAAASALLAWSAEGERS